MSRSPYPLVPLGEVLKERQETPSAEELLNGNLRIVAKIGFNDGQIQLRSGTETRTGMILIRPGDLVVSGINAAKGAIAFYDAGNAAPIAATIHYGAYIPDLDRVKVRYLWWLLRSQTFRDLLAEYVPGGIKTELKAKRLLPIPIPIPSITEQRRLVARIEELAARIEEARGLRRETMEAAKVVLVQSINEAIGNISLSGVLADVLKAKPRNGWSATCDNSEDGSAILSLGAVTGFRYKASEFKRTSLPVPPDKYCWLQPGDLLITRSNTPDLVGHAAIYDGSPSPCVYPDLMMHLIVDEVKADKHFIHWWLQSGSVREYIRREAKGTSPSMKKISQGVVMQIPYPSHLTMQEQRRIVAYLDRLQAKVDALKQLQAETAAELDALLPAVLEKAFRGEL